MLEQEFARSEVNDGCQIKANISPAEFLALQVIYGNDEQAGASWKQFRADGFDIDTLYLSRGLAVLPLLSKRLSNLFPDEPWLGKMRGFSRYTLTRNIFLLNTLKTILTTFHEHEIESTIFGDAALLLKYYEIGMRPIEKLALLVDGSDLENARALAAQIEIPEMVPERRPNYQPLEIYRSIHGVRLVNPDADATQVQFAEHEFQILNAPNLLLILLLDVCHLELSQSQWFMDTALVLNSCSDSDLACLMQKAKSMRIATPISQALTFFEHTVRIVNFEPSTKASTKPSTEASAKTSTEASAKTSTQSSSDSSNNGKSVAARLKILSRGINEIAQRND